MNLIVGDLVYVLFANHHQVNQYGIVKKRIGSTITIKLDNKTYLTCDVTEIAYERFDI